MYDLARYGPSKILVGTPVPVLPCSFSPSPSSHDGPAQYKQLSHDFLIRTFKGREQAQRFMAAFIATQLQCRSPSGDCLYADDEPPSQMCHESFFFITLNMLRSVGGIACGRDGDPLFSLTQATEMLSRSDFSDGRRQCGLRLCHPCKVDFAASATMARQEAWSLLPQWFGLEERKTDVDAMCE